MPWAIALLLSVTLASPFGEASARLIGFTPDVVTIEVSVEVLEPAALVLLRGEDVAGTEVDPVALLQREDGTWGAVVELPARLDIRLAFELIPPVGGSTVSGASSMVELGISGDVLTFVGAPDLPSDETAQPVAGLPWIILAVLAGLTAIALLAVWTRSGSSADDPEDDPADDEHAGVAVDGG
ncbi:MAG: hypothetical protein HKN91_01680 [Acidimicrobiia bacterium]|nr:hypothetical protein [Acidimicrobiia bacterium]